MVQNLWNWIRQHAYILSVCVLLLLLAAKFLYPVFAFELPLGYDPGMYRYLFFKYADAFPPFVIPELRPWAQEYPYGLFIFSSLLMKIGVPVDWFMGWIWSAMAVALVGLLAFIFAKREGRTVGLVTLLTGLLSVAYYDGFAAMYWKTFLSLFFLILTLHLFERKSLWMVPAGALCLLSHNQTGLILGLVLMAWWVVHLPTDWKDPVFRKWTLAFAAIAVLGIVWYAPIWFRAFWAPFRSVLLLRGDAAPGGGFPEAIHYVRYAGILLSCGTAGWLMSFRKERFSVWQLSVAVCAVFVIFKLVFYRRFFLQLDFFLLPFAAMAIAELWKHALRVPMRLAIVALLIAQAYLSYPQMIKWKPGFGVESLREIQSLPDFIEPDASVIALENRSAVWLLGWLNGYYTGGPGLFDYPAWKYEDWEKFLYGSHEDRVRLLGGIDRRPLYFMTSPLFFSHYGDYIKPFLADSCFEAVEGAPLLKVLCDPK